MRNKRRYADDIRVGRPPEKNDGKKDKIGVFIRRVGNKKHEPFFVRLARIGFNGSSALIFGRMNKDGSDRKVEVAEIVFRRPEDVQEFKEFNPDLEHPCIRIDEQMFVKGF